MIHLSSDFRAHPNKSLVLLKEEQYYQQIYLKKVAENSNDNTALQNTINKYLEEKGYETSLSREEIMNELRAIIE